MAAASDIGASASNYTGNQGLGGGSFGFVKLDTGPIEDLAKYTMLYNKAQYDQQQKDAEAAAAEIAELTKYDVTSGIPKDAKLLQDKYDELLKFVSNNPDAYNYRNKEQWAKFQKMKADLSNDIRSAKVRSTLYTVRKKEIADEKNPELKKIMEQDLESEVEKTDIRTPINYTQQFDSTLPNMPVPEGYSFDVYFKGANEDQKRQFDMWNVQKARAQSSAFGLELGTELADPNTPEGQRKAIVKRNNFWLNGSEQLNAAIQNPAYRVDGKLDESKLKGLTKQLVDLAKQTNSYLQTKKSEIAAGVYTDKFGKPISFGSGLLREEDYAPINYEDGVSPDELALMAEFAAWKGDSYKTQTIQTNTQTEQARLALTRRGQDLENARFYAGLNNKNSEDLLGADAVIREVSDAINNGTPKSIQIIKNGQTTTRDNTIEIADPNLLREFGSIDKDGNVTNVPSVVHYNEKTNKLSLIYYKKDEETGDVAKAKGNPLVDREVEMLPTQWLGQVTKRKNPNKDIGGVNNLIDEVYNKYGRNLKKMASEYRGGATISTGSSSSSSSTTGGKSIYHIKGKDYTEDELIGMGYTVDQIKQYKK